MVSNMKISVAPVPRKRSDDSIPYEGGATFGYGSVTPVTPPPGELAPGGFYFVRAASTATLNSTVAVAGLSRSERGARPGNFCPDTEGAFPALWPSSRSSRWSGQPFSVLHTKRQRRAGVPALTGNTGWTESFLTAGGCISAMVEETGSNQPYKSLETATPTKQGDSCRRRHFITSEFRGHPFLKSVAERRPSQPNADESRSTRTDGTVLIRDRAGNQTRLSSSSSPSNRHPGEVPVRHQGSLSKTPARETRLTQY